jgi:uncharacterized protein
MKTLFAILGLFLFSVLPAQAQDKTPPPAQTTPPPSAAAPADQQPEKKLDPVKEADIRKMLDIVGAKATMQQAIDRLEKSIRPLMAQALPAGAYREQLITLFFEKFQAKLDLQKMLDQAVQIYDKYYTDEDIKGLIQFYQTPLGQKYVATLPKITQELAEGGQALGQGIGRQCMLEVLAEHPELEKQMEEAQKNQQP